MYIFICKSVCGLCIDVCTSEGAHNLFVYEDVCKFACELTSGMRSNSVSQPLQYIEDAKLLSEEVFGLFMEVVQYNNDNREVSLYSESIISLPGLRFCVSFSRVVMGMSTLTSSVSG